MSNDILHIVDYGNEYDQARQRSFCSGCGACAVVDKAFHIRENANGCYQAEYDGSSPDLSMATHVCPFVSSLNEDDLGTKLFGSFDGIKHDCHIGYYLNAYVGYVKSGDYRAKGSSGGFISWLSTTMLAEGDIDYVIHVRNGGENGEMYSYQISSTAEEIQSGAKSKYYPIRLDEVLDYVRSHDGRYLFIGIPCFVKAVRLLCNENHVLAERIPYCIGLVCGHLKSKFFAQAEAWECGVKPENLVSVDFRYKTLNSSAGDYDIDVRSKVDPNQQILKRAQDLTISDWGEGYFKYGACEFCDDVVSETADVTFGDAWLPNYIDDAKGMNVIVIRNPRIQEIFDRHADELTLHDSDAEEVTRSQAGGFRHRRQGLAYRLAVRQNRGEWIPTKRVKPSMDMPEKRQTIYAMREVIREESFVGFKKALNEENYKAFQRHIARYVRKYRNIGKPLWKKIARRFLPSDVRKFLSLKAGKLFRR